MEDAASNHVNEKWEHERTPPIVGYVSLRLAEMNAVVTGGAGGIGSAIAHGFAREGAAVACLDIRGDAAELVAQSIVSDGGRAWGWSCDAKDPDQVQSSVGRSLDHMGRVDVLMATVGGSDEIVPFLEIEPDEWHAVIDRNVTSTYLTASMFGRVMAEQAKGSIVVTSSQLGVVARPGLASYCAAKAAVSHLVKAMAVDLAQHGVRANAIAPGPTMTEKTRVYLEQAEFADEMRSNIVLGRFGQPEDMVGAAVFLASDESSFVTGTTILVDGGYTLR